MAWVLHLFFPFLAALIAVFVGGWGASNMWVTYLMFSAPYWLWFLLSGYLDVSRPCAFGGFFGTHFFLVAVAILVFTSSSHEAANGWFFYLLGSPVFLAVGAFIVVGLVAVDHAQPNPSFKQDALTRAS